MCIVVVVLDVFVFAAAAAAAAVDILFLVSSFRSGEFHIQLGLL